MAEDGAYILNQSSIAAAVASGFSNCGRWPQSGITTSFAHGILSASSVENAFGTVLSVSLVRTRVGHLIEGRRGRESARVMIASSWCMNASGPTVNPSHGRPFAGSRPAAVMDARSLRTACRERCDSRLTWFPRSSPGGVR